MTDNNVFKLNKPEQNDPLHEVLREGTGLSKLDAPDLSGKRYVYVWADGIYSTVRMDDRLCLLVIIGSDETGHKELLALSDG